MTAPWTSGVIRARGEDRPPRTVVKFGGSLLVRRAWPEDLGRLLAKLPGSVTIVVGGGPLVDGLRAIDAAGVGPGPLMDRLAIEAMGITATLVAEVVGLPMSTEPAHEGRCVLDAPSWIARHRRACDLPIGWTVTSDSIAAAVAGASDAELLLAKSAPPPSGASLEDLARLGWVDDQFPSAACDVADIRWAAPEPLTPTSSR